MLCTVIDGTVVADNKLYRLGSKVDLSEAEATRLEKLGVVNICKDKKTLPAPKQKTSKKGAKK